MIYDRDQRVADAIKDQQELLQRFSGAKDLGRHIVLGIFLIMVVFFSGATALVTFIIANKSQPLLGEYMPVEATIEDIEIQEIMDDAGNPSDPVMKKVTFLHVDYETELGELLNAKILMPYLSSHKEGDVITIGYDPAFPKKVSYVNENIDDKIDRPFFIEISRISAGIFLVSLFILYLYGRKKEKVVGL